MCTRLRSPHASALPYRDSNGQPVFCQMLSDAEVSGQQQCLLCNTNVKAGACASTLAHTSCSSSWTAMCVASVAAPHAPPSSRAKGSRASLRA
eukprot:scaffold223190_cov18-Tisochrysis_lutea.AAC.1